MDSNTSIDKYITVPSDDLKCPMCLEVATDPMQHEGCGKLFCKKCLQRNGKKKPCPCCRGEQPKYFEDAKSKQEIRALIVKCDNDECTLTMERGQLGKHVNTECDYTEVPCKYAKLGCGVKMQRKSIAKHELDDDNSHKTHLQMAINTMVKLESVMKRIDQSFKFKIPNVQELKNANERFESQLFYTSSPKGYHMGINVYVFDRCDGSEGTDISVYVDIVNGKDDDELRWPFVGKVTITLLNQMEDNNHQEKVVNIDTEDDLTNDSEETVGFPAFIELGHNITQKTQYLKDDTLYFSISVVTSEHKSWLKN